MSRLTVFDPSFDKYKVRVDGHTLHTIEEPYEVWLLGGVVDKLAEYENTQQWISVKERLPDENALVLCAGARGGMFLGKIRWLYEEDGTAYCHVPNARCGRSATHWMPLPNVPEV